MVSEAVELFGEIAYVDFGDGGDNTGIGGGFWYNFSETFAAGLSLTTDDDITSFGGSIRVYFDN